MAQHACMQVLSRLGLVRVACLLLPCLLASEVARHFQALLPCPCSAQPMPYAKATQRLLTTLKCIGTPPRSRCHRHEGCTPGVRACLLLLADVLACRHN